MTRSKQLTVFICTLLCVQIHGDECRRQFNILQADIENRERMLSYGDEVYRKEATILAADRDPLDVVLRRTRALLEDLQRMPEVPDLAAQATALADLDRAAESATPGTDGRYALYEQACALRREIAFANPLLNFDEILFLKRHRALYNHMCDQYYGINARPGGGICVLRNPFGSNPEVRDILADSMVESGRLKGQTLAGGSFLSPDLSFDGQHILFAYVECEGSTKQDFHTDPSRGHWSVGRSYHLFHANIDGSGLNQLTDGTWNDFDPCWMPNGRVVFVSERRGGYLRCGRACPTYTLFDMLPDGSDIQLLSPHENNEWHPSITHEGMIIYTRWDYVDRHGCTAHPPWITTPDGRDSRAVHGNFATRSKRPDMELDLRAIPGSHRLVATAAPHHGQAFGSLIIVDPRVEDDDAMAPVKRLTPEVGFPESQGGAQVYGTAWPLSEDYFLCVYDADMKPKSGRQGGKHHRGDYGIYLLDSFGNKELIYRDPTIACQNPMPLRARPTPPIVPTASQRGADAPEEGTIAVLDVYNSRMPWPPNTKISALRIFQLLPMSVPSGAPPHETGVRIASAGDSVVITRRVLGTVPVEEDGSAHFVVPALKELYFQSLDERGLAVQSMRSATWVQPGEQLICQGCHQAEKQAPPIAFELPIALRREPSRPTPDVDGSNPFSYPRLVQPVLDRHCVECHADKAPNAPPLDSRVVVEGRKKWYQSYFSLAPKYGFFDYGNPYRSMPGKVGARASKLFPLLEKGHYEVKLTPEELHRITLWLDASSVFYGVYEKEGGEAQLRAEVVQPTLE
jgi:hypothetical protein